MLNLHLIPKTDLFLRGLMSTHYSTPRGFVGRSLCYKVFFNGVCYGAIVAGSATLHLPGARPTNLNAIVNNAFYSISKRRGYDPRRNFTSHVIENFVDVARVDWERFYGDRVVRFETLIEPPRTGELYRRAGWFRVGETKGFTCKRIAGEGSDSWSGSRVWDTKNLRPKLVWALDV